MFLGDNKEIRTPKSIGDCINETLRIRNNLKIIGRMSDKVEKAK